jgi:hypothetical protein
VTQIDSVPKNIRNALFYAEMKRGRKIVQKVRLRPEFVSGVKEEADLIQFTTRATALSNNKKDKKRCEAISRKFLAGGCKKS